MNLSISRELNLAALSQIHPKSVSGDVPAVVPEFAQLFAQSNAPSSSLSQALLASFSPSTTPTVGQSINHQSHEGEPNPGVSSFHAADTASQQDKLRDAFHNFVGQTFFSQMLSSLRSTQQGSSYFNGGQAEKIFQGQLDQVLAEELTKSSVDQIADPMFKLFQLQRSS